MKVTAQALQRIGEGTVEEMRLQAFPKNIQWQQWSDFMRQCFTAGKQRLEKLNSTTFSWKNL